jgi:Fimbrial assembly protein (PilN)
VIARDLGADHVRQALTGLGSVIAIVIVGIAIETFRLQRLETMAHNSDTALFARASMRVKSQRLTNDLARYREIGREAKTVRLSGPFAAVSIARIGNAIPARVWLESLDRTSNGFELSGQSLSVDALSEAMLSLARVSSHGTALLVSIDRRDTTSNIIRFTLRIVDQAVPVSPR